MMTALLVVLLVVVAVGFVAVCVAVGVEATRNPFVMVWWFCFGGFEATAKVAGVVLLAICEAIDEASK